MKIRFFKKCLLCSFLVLSSCHFNTKTTSVLPITNTVLSFPNDETLKVDKYVNDSSIFKYQNDSNEWIDFDCLAFGIDFDSLI